MRTILARATLAAACLMVSAPVDAAEFSAKFSGFKEVGGIGAAQTGAIFSAGRATLDLDLNRRASTATFKLTYNDLGTPVTQAHIHFGKKHVGGGIIVFLCSNLGNGPAGTQPCPPNGGTVTGTLTAASVVGPTPQNITPGNFDAFVAALDSDTAYGNIHTTQFPAGEIRGQVRDDDRDDHRGDDHDHH
jgi:CHRD domain-containing protein